MPLGLSGPVEERFRQAAQSRRALGQRGEFLPGSFPDLWLGENLGFAFLGRFGYELQQPFGEGALIVFVPDEFRGDAGIVAIVFRFLAACELGLDAYIRPLNRLIIMGVGRRAVAAAGLRSILEWGGGGGGGGVGGIS